MKLGKSKVVNQNKIMQQLQAAAKLHNHGELDKAEVIYRAVLDVDPNNFLALRFLGCLLSSKGRYQSAISLLRKAVTIVPSNPECWFNLGNAYHLNSQTVESLKAYCSAEELGSMNPELFNNMGRCLQKLSRFKESVAALEKGIHIDSRCFGAWFALGNSWRHLGNTSRAILCYKRAIYASPSFVDAYINLGLLLKDEGKIEEAIASYRKATEIDPNHVTAYLNLSLLLKDEGRIEEAILIYRKVIEIKPNCVGALSCLAGELRKKDEYEEAISLYKRALEEDPAHVNSAAGLGLCFLKSAHVKEAVEYYSNLLLHSSGDLNSFYFLFESLRGHLPKKLNERFSYSVNFLQKSLIILGVSKLVAFGDSHINLFDGCSEIEVNHVGASTAYNLLNEDSFTGGRRSILSRLGRMDKKTEAVLLSFGEVDIRANVIKYCYQRGLSIEECVDNVAFRFIAFAEEIASQGFRVLIYGGYGAGGDRNSVGSARERNFAAKHLNLRLSQKCKEHGFVYFSLHDAFFDEECLETEASVLPDGFHLYDYDMVAKSQIQLLLFERLCKAVKALYYRPQLQSSRDLVLGNVGLSNSLKIGILDSGCLSWEEEVDRLSSIVFDLGACIRFESISLQFDSNVGLVRLTLILDGRLVEVKASQKSSCCWQLLPEEQFASFIGRYLMLKASSSSLLAIKGFSFQELSLI